MTTTGSPVMLQRYQCAVCGLTVFRPTSAPPHDWQRVRVWDSASTLLDALVCGHGCAVRAIMRAQP